MKLNWGQYRRIVQMVVISNEKVINRQIVINQRVNERFI